MIRALFLFILMVVVTFPLQSGAVTGTPFSIRALIGEDTIPPTTPSILAANPITSDQVNVSWSAATDNYSLAGYQLFRDGVQVATTSATSYADGGLMPETLYTYTVRAYDAAGNVSSSSAPVATSTFAIPAPPPAATTTDSTTSANPTYVPLRSLSVTAGRTTASVDFTTRFPTRFALRFGRTSAYDGGFVVSDLYWERHQTLLTDLEPGTRYEYELTVYDELGRDYVVSRGDFTTAAAPDTTPPPNVRNLRVEVAGADVTLRFDPPPGGEVVRVRVMRNYWFYPTHPQDGYFVYEGAGTTALDPGALAIRDVAYYTVFAYDAAGNVSSGAIVYAHRPGASSPTPGVPAPGTGSGAPPRVLPGEGNGGPSVPPSTTALQLGAADIELAQGERRGTFADSTLEFDNVQPLTVRIDYDVLPEHLKTIILDVVDEAGVHRGGYLLRINKGKTAYEAVVPPLAGVAAATFTVTVFDHELAARAAASTTVRYVAGDPLPRPPLLEGYLLPLLIRPEAGAALGFVVLLWLVLFWRRRRRAQV